MLEGFIRWLAQRKLPPGTHRRYHLAVQRFRGWHASYRHHLPGPTHDLRRHDIEYGRRRYLAALRAGGYSPSELRVINEALEQLCHYLDHPR